MIMQFLESHKEKSELLVLPFWQGPLFAGSQKEMFKECLPLVESGDFTAKEGEVSLFYGSKRVLLLGLGKQEKVTLETLRCSYSAACKYANSKKLSNCQLVLPKIAPDLFRGIAEGFALANYNFDFNKSEKASLVEKVYIIGKHDLTEFIKATSVAEGVFLARDLVNGNADAITPDSLADLAKLFQKRSKLIKSKILRKKEIEKEGMGLILAVSRASLIEPALIVMEYKGNPKSKENPVFIGKGITFDTGGLLIKPRGGMETMRCDMAGAAACFGILHVLQKLNVKINATFVIPASENGIGSKAYKPGDVYKCMNGKSVEIVDTDAEGRLVLADAICYAKKYLKPTQVIDMATLTGAMLISLGEEMAGMFSNDDTLASQLQQAADITHERLWRMPLINDYKAQLKSDMADIRNKGDRNGGSIIAALFLQDFVGDDVTWAHLDIAGTAFYSKERSYNPKNATGYGVRLLLEFLNIY